MRRAMLAVALLLPLAVEASGLRLTPLRLDLSSHNSTTQIELSNLGTAPVAVQIKAYRWSQRDGEDVYEPTRDIFFAPPIVTVPGQGKTVVRFRLRGKVPHLIEAAYRVYFQEIPPAEAATPAGMAFRIRFGVPLFVAPHEPALPGLAANARREGDGIAVTLANRGQAHLKIEGADLFSGTVDRASPGAPLAAATHSVRGANYILPQSVHDWRLAAPAESGGRLWLRVRTNDYSGRAARGMSDRGWLWLPVAEAATGAGE